MLEKYDALLIVSFGGPEGMQDVEPFLHNVLRGRNVPPERMKEVAHHYELFDGISPINEQNRKLIAAVESEFKAHGMELPVYWGNRNWHPFLADTIKQMKADGVKNALAFVTSAYSSYSGCRQYRDNITNAQQQIESAPNIDKLRIFYNHPGFIEANIERVSDSLQKFENPKNVHVMFTAHSIPSTMADNCDYQSQLLETSRLVAQGANLDSWKLGYQSRSGPASQPWLGPDVCDYIKECANENIRELIIAPIGFVSDHMEVIYDLDTEAHNLCVELGIKMVRAGTAGTHPSFVRMIRNLVEERLYESQPKLSLGSYGPRPDFCEPNCCPLGGPPKPN